ncbi:MAG: hypothetical protein Q4F13_00950 [Pseudomonadota bacterium]|nr:hypothetical protein [Pseudomonadota bacterium]
MIIKIHSKFLAGMCDNDIFFFAFLSAPQPVNARPSMRTWQWEERRFL